jgi:hypothetical protein
MSVTFVSVSVVHPRAAAAMTFGEPAPVASNGIRFDLPLNASTRIDVARSPNSSTDSTTVADSPSPRESGAPFWVRLAPWIASLYGIGVLLMLSRLGVSVWHANRISQRGKVLRDGPLAQGQRPLSCCSGEGLHEELIIPSAAAAFHGQAVFTRMLFEQR